MTIEEKIAKNGTVMYFTVDENGKKTRVKATADVVIEFAIQTRDAYRAKVAAEREEILSTPLVTVEAQDAAIDAEIELANNTEDDTEGFDELKATEIAEAIGKLIAERLLQRVFNQPQTNWVNPHDFSAVGDLSDRNLYGRIIAANNAREQEQELAEMKAGGIKFLLKVITPQMHPYRKFNFQTVTNPYKSLDVLKKYGGTRIHEHDWRIETIDGELIAKGNGVTDFINFFNVKEESTLTDNFKHDDFNAKLAKLQANVAVARKIFGEKQELVRQAKLETEKACNSYEDAKRELTRLFEFKAATLSNKIIKPNNSMKLFDQDGQTHFGGRNLHVLAHFDSDFKGCFLITDGDIYCGNHRAIYYNPEHVSRVINLFNDAITRGVKEFKFPTVDQLNLPEQPQAASKKQIRDSLHRAIDKAKLEYQIASVSGNQSKANFERELYLIAKKAARELKL